MALVGGRPEGHGERRHRDAGAAHCADHVARRVRVVSSHTPLRPSALSRLQRPAAGLTFLASFVCAGLARSPRS